MLVGTGGLGGLRRTSIRIFRRSYFSTNGSDGGEIRKGGVCFLFIQKERRSEGLLTGLAERGAVIFIRFRFSAMQLNRKQALQSHLVP